MSVPTSAVKRANPYANVGLRKSVPKSASESRKRGLSGFIWRTHRTRPNKISITLDGNKEPKKKQKSEKQTGQKQKQEKEEKKNAKTGNRRRTQNEDVVGSVVGIVRARGQGVVIVPNGV